MRHPPTVSERVRLLLVIVFAALALPASPASADTLRMTSGRDVECVILGETADRYTIRRGYGVMDVPRSMVATVTRAAKPSAGPATRPAAAAVTEGSAGRFPTWANVVDAIARQPWAVGLQQIPATYIDNGVLKDVPYQSYAVDDYEVNIYGDPDDPACIEIGIHRGLLRDDAAKHACVELLANVLPNGVDAAIARSMSLAKDLVTRYGFTIEVTPPDAPDAYGGWWVSIYDEAKLEKARATPAEIAALTVPTPATAPPAPRPAASPKPQPAPAPAPPQAPARNLTGDDTDNDWTTADLTRRSARGASNATGGNVYVRGYHRRDGTYVSPHTRRR